MRKNPIKIESLDHIVLTVADLQRSLDFYVNTLGMEEISFGSGRKALKFGSQKFNLHEAGREFEPKAARPTPGAIDLCLVTRTPLETVIEQLTSGGAGIIEGPVETTGAVGPIRSVYVRDPDGNLIEVCNRMGERQVRFPNTNQLPGAGRHRL